LRDVIHDFIHGSKTVIYSDLSVPVIESRHEVNYKELKPTVQ
jgi:hypothetical protein